MQRLCGNCLKLVETHVEKKTEEHWVKGMRIEIDANVRICDNCGEEVFDKDLDSETLNNVYKIYRERSGLLPIEKMKGIREKYDLTQTAFAKILGLGDKTVTRYENGSIPDEAPNNLIYLCDEPMIFLTLL